ncbi:MAG: XRE family transcriptional regulator [Selenomonadaceae bacterium]|nr:XRE family transcriptional regulator [Selenomonadaceae bacterium]
MTDLKVIESLVHSYIEKNFRADVEEEKVTLHGIFEDVELDKVDFLKLYAQAKTGGETFSEMLLRLIKESGEDNSTIYNRANIDRRHFSKISTHEDYRPSKQTVLAFAIALKLDFERTKDLLAVAGFSLTKSNFADLIVSFFIEYRIYDVDLVNRILHKYEQPLLGG